MIVVIDTDDEGYILTMGVLVEKDNQPSELIYSDNSRNSFKYEPARMTADSYECYHEVDEEDDEDEDETYYEMYANNMFQGLNGDDTYVEYLETIPVTIFNIHTMSRFNLYNGECDTPTSE